VTKLRTAQRTCPRGTLTQLLVDHTTETPVEVRVELSNSNTVKRFLRRECAKTMPKNPASLLTLDEEWTIISDQEQFLIHESGVNSSDRMLVFATNNDLRHLANSHSWYMDGIFIVTLLLLTQLYM